MHGFIFFVGAFLALIINSANGKRVVCYFGSWAVQGSLKIENIDTNLCTHYIYSFAGLEGNKIASLDKNLDLPGGGDGYRKFNNLRNRNPSIKTLLAIGGWNVGSGPFSRMVANPGSRREFIESVIPFLKQYNFNGLDLDWENPAQREGSSPQDPDNLVLLARELRAEFNKHGFILSAAVAAPESSASISYRIRELSQSLDFISLMSYDLHSGSEPKTALHSPLHSVPPSDQYTIDACVNHWLQQGCPADKIIVGIPTYGKSWTLADPNSNGIGAQGAGLGNAGPDTRDAGTLSYYEICQKINKEGWTQKFDEARGTPYAFKGNQWVSFDNPRSVRDKAGYIQSRGLGGAMIWSLENDDTRGLCGEKYPLVRRLREVLG